MARKSLDELGQLQEAIMEAIWELGEATVRQVRDHLKRRKRLAYTTVLSTMQKLRMSGWLTYRSEGRTHVYRAVRTREEEGGTSLNKFVDKVFRGNRLLLFQQLIMDEGLAEDELQELKKMIAKKRREKSK